MSVIDGPRWVISWHWYHGAPSPEFHETLADAVLDAYCAQHSDGGVSLGLIEVIGTSGAGRRLIGRDELDRLMEPWETADAVERAAQPKTTAFVDLCDPHGRWGIYRGFPSAAEAEEVAVSLRVALGAERVRVRTVGA